MNDDGRPDPQALLRTIQKLDAREGLGRLRVFLGMCPGVGKTYAMLKAAREQQRRGVKVAVGIVETHGRKETEEMVSGLDVVPKHELNYKGTTLTEMDLDAILKNPPQLILVDELAHTNAPGSRHVKRYQDVEELLRAGIDVFTTLNIQHVESRNDQIAQITSVSVKETVPDSILELASQIELIDLSPAELLWRMKEGKVYLGDRAEKAAQNFFQEEKLTALRELALRFTAEKVDRDLHEQMTMKGIEGPWNTNERILVAVSYSPYSGRLIRAARRLAYTLQAPWIALYVDTGELLQPEDSDMLKKNVELARELGAEVVTLADNDLNRAIQKICREKNVTQIIMGRPDRRFLRDLLARGTLLDRLVSTTSKIDVHVIRAERAPRYRGFRLRWPYIKSGFFPYYNTVWFLAAVTFCSYMLLPYIGYKAIGPLYLLAILAVASIGSRGPIIFAAVTSALVWDFFFIPPQFTFAVSGTEDVMMVISFLAAAIVGGFLTSRIRRQEEVLQVREERARELYELSKSLAEAKSQLEITTLLGEKIEKQFRGRSMTLLRQLDGKLRRPDAMEENDFAVANWVFENNKSAGWSTSTLAGAQSLCLPMRGNSGLLGVVALYPSVKQGPLSLEQENFLDTILTQVSLALERLRFSEEAQTAKIYETSERLHQTLLNSISHELRTPLTVIIGSATSLAEKNAPPEFVSSVAKELLLASDRLNRVIENLLDMSRLNSGVLALKLEWHDLQDLVSAAVQKLGGNLSGHKLELEIASGLPPVKVDFRLLEHALSNLILNAATYSPAGTSIRVSVEMHGSQLLVMTVEDQGPGIPEADRERIFEKFYRIPGTKAGGTGLGLSIVKSIVEVHKGRVYVEASGLGSKFVIEVPVTETPPVPARE